MKVFKSPKNGFSLIETVMALTVVALGLTPLFLTQGRVTQDVGTMLASWRAIVALKNEQCDVMRMNVFNGEQPPELREKTVDGIVINFQLKHINEKSSLKNIKNLQLLTSSARWEFFSRPFVVLMARGVVVPEKQEANEESSDHNTQSKGSTAS